MVSVWSAYPNHSWQLLLDGLKQSSPPSPPIPNQQYLLVEDDTGDGVPLECISQLKWPLLDGLKESSLDRGLLGLIGSWKSVYKISKKKNLII